MKIQRKSDFKIGTHSFFTSTIHKWLLRNYVDSSNKTLDKKAKPCLTDEIVVALKEYLSAKLAHFLVLPLLFNNDYDKKELNSMIRKNIQLRYPPYWLKIEAGHIFWKLITGKSAFPKRNII